MNIWTTIDRFLGPPVCQLCGGRGLGPEICRGCYRDLPRAHRACPSCARPTVAVGRCSQCVRKRPVFTRAMVPFVYAFPVDKMIRRLKYRERLPHARLFGELLGHAARRLDCPPAGLVPVPLHRRRLRQRGFNQAREIASAAARVAAIPLLDRACVRRVDTPPLWALDPAQRRACLSGAFECHAVLPARVAVVDDVLTTGSTVTALVRALKRAGAREVQVWAVARSPGTAAPASAPSIPGECDARFRR